MWFQIGGDARLGRCATEGCGQHPSWRLEVGNIGSDYCDPCRRKIEEICCGCGAGHGSLEGHLDWCDMAEANGMDTMQHEANKQSNLNMIAAAERESEISRLRAEVERLREALAWYGEQARLARLIHSEGDKGRSALAGDGGDYARKALEGGE